jgi:hypothetical protein
VADLPYLINDADNHFNEPADCFERYIDPSKADLAIREVVAPDGQKIKLFAGKPSKFHFSHNVYSPEELEKMVGDTSNLGFKNGRNEDDKLIRIPGMLLNKMNPLKGLSDEERAAFIQEFRGVRQP